MNAQLLCALIALAWSGAAGVVAIALLSLRRQRSLRTSLIAVAGVSVIAVVAGIIGAARMMFVSAHDFAVTLLVSGVAALVGLVVALVVAGHIMRDVGVLVDGAAQLAEDGADSPARTIAMPRTKELRLVGLELQRTSDRLTASRARERAAEAARRELVSWVSHDLRTPLAGIRAMAEALEDNVADDPARYHRQIRHEVDRMARMVDDLFELSRIQSGALSLQRARVGLSELVSDVVAGARPVAEARGVRLAGSLETPEAGVMLDADSARLGRVLANLVINAIRHTPSDGTVCITAVAEGSDAVFSVSDECGGIPADDLDRVFEPGWRAAAARSPQWEVESAAGIGAGAGLGLAIARGLVNAHGGALTVTNARNGCRFEARVPVNAPAG